MELVRNEGGGGFRAGLLNGCPGVPARSLLLLLLLLLLLELTLMLVPLLLLLLLLVLVLKLLKPVVLFGPCTTRRPGWLLLLGP